MKRIDDQVSGLKNFPLGRLISEISAWFAIPDSDTVCILRVGGAGDRIWQYEQTLIQGKPLSVSMSDLATCAAADDEFFDLLYCRHDKVTFGIFDATFMFVQTADKKLEAAVAHSFLKVSEGPDYKL